MLFKFPSPKFWYQKNIISYLLLPISFIYLGIVILRHWYYRFFPGKKLSIPVIVVGNITVGGTGKTPLVMALAELLKNKGYKPAIITRGYGGKSKKYPLYVTLQSKVEEVGDEALLLKQRIECPVVVDPQRMRAAESLIASGQCNVIINDDGLQHYALARDIEIAVIDAELGFGNGFCLPAGPLRETPARLQEVNFIIKNYNTDAISDDAYGMFLQPTIFYNVKNTNLTKGVEEFKNVTVHAYAGIGDPKKFFKTLRQMGLTVIEYPFPDHYIFQASNFLFKDHVIIMTEKDAVKCCNIANDNCWYLKVDSKISGKFCSEVIRLLNNFNKSI